MEHQENDCVAALFQSFDSPERELRKLSAGCTLSIHVRFEHLDREDFTKTTIADSLSSYVSNHCKDVVINLIL